MEIDDMFDDDEDRDISMSLSGKVEKQEPVAWSRLDTAKSVITENEDIKRGWDLDGLPFKCLFDSPQPCPECDEKQSAIDVWEGRYADKTAECEKLKAKIDLTNTLAQQSNQDHLNVRKDYQGEIIKLKAERDDALRYKKYWSEWVSLQSGDIQKLPERAAQADIIEAERDELAAQVERMREALMLGATVIDPDDCPTITQEMHEALALPDLSTSILNRMRAETAERCAEVCDVHATGWKASPGCNPMAGFIASSNCATDIRALAADMEAK